MARAPKRVAEPVANDGHEATDIERRLWVVEQAIRSKPLILADGSFACGVCQTPLVDVFDKGCEAEEGCPCKATE
jgi:hypothetical protein